MNFFFIRGLSRESGHWGDFISVFIKHFPEAKITLIDLPGFGVHTKTQSPSSVQKIVKFLKQNYRVEKDEVNFIVASSLGGIVAIEWLTKYQDDFKGVVLINSSLNGVCGFFERIKKPSLSIFFKIFFSWKIENKEKLILEINSNFPEKHSKILIDWIEIQHLRKAKRKNIFFQSVAGLKYEPTTLNRKTSVLFLASKNDKLVCENCFQKVNQFLGGKIVWNQSAGHCIPLDDPTWVANEIYKWILVLK